MTLNVTIGQQTPLTVTMGSIASPSAIRPAPGQASLGDFLFNTFSQSLRNQVVVSATPRRIEVQATTGIPAFVSVGGRWGVVTSTVFVDSVVAGTRYLFADLSANDGRFVLATGASASPGAWQKLLGIFSDSGAAIVFLNTGVLGLATVDSNLLVYGLGVVGFYDQTGAILIEGSAGNTSLQGFVQAQGANAGFVANDRTGVGRWLVLYRTGDVVKFDDAINGTMATISNTGGWVLAPTATGTTGLTVNGKASATAPLARFDASATTNGQVVTLDKNGHLAISQAAVPTGVLGTGAGNGAGTAPVLTVTGTDQSGTIQIVTGTQVPVAAATLVTMTFRTAMAAVPAAVGVWPHNTAAAGLARNQDVYTAAGTISTTQWSAFSNSVALAISTTYVWHYRVGP